MVHSPKTQEPTDQQEKLAGQALSAEALSPMIEQYTRMKEQVGDAILFFRCGDFYEMFMDDAVRAAEALDIAQTKKHVGKGQTIPMAGVPYHAAQPYLYRLTRQGYRVAICEQMEQPQKGKKIVKREVVRTVSPGTIIEADVIDAKDNNFLAALYDGGVLGCGLAYVDVTTGEFHATWEAGGNGETNGGQAWRSVLSELATLNPSEILIDDTSMHPQGLCRQLGEQTSCLLTPVNSGFFSPKGLEACAIQERIESGLNVGPSEKELCLAAAAAILSYLQENQKETLGYIQSLDLYKRSGYLLIDRSTERNLELLTSTGEGGKKFSLLGILDLTVTAMGGRLLKQWIQRPLINLKKILTRQRMVALLAQQPNLRDNVRRALRTVHDLERLLGRVTFGNANARDLAALRSSLEQIPEINQTLVQVDATPESTQSDIVRRALQREEDPETPIETLPNSHEALDPVPEVRELLAAALVDDPPLSVRDGGMFRDGYEPELDELRSIRRDGRGYIARLQEEERGKTGISSLKVSYNKVFGYYIEVTHAHKDKVPEHYIRKQTLTNAERFITSELKEFEAKVLHAEDRIHELEYQLLQQLLEAVRGYGLRLKSLARMVARLDALQSLAEAASRYGYCAPELNEDGRIEIKEGRHPVLERSPVVDQFVPNDCRLNGEDQQILLITGPNMAGKSTYIRQVALIVLMAQMGSFVPARHANISRIDCLFSRVGASDDLARGRSTFMVEMSEAAHILKNATPKSLVILDEIGRGTSTFDGVSLAWAIVEYIHGLRGKGVKTLFATHYHELAALEDTHKRVVNYQVQISEENGGISFLHRIAPGYTDHSYGIHVAELAGVPKRVTQRARKILKRLERGEHLGMQSTAQSDTPYQISLFSMMDEPLRARLLDLDINSLSPMEALHVLQELIDEAKR